MSRDHLLFKQYDAIKYNCAHFLLDAWFEVTGSKLPDNVVKCLMPNGRRHLGMGIRHGLVRSSYPISPCIVVMSKPGYQPHVGLYVDNKVYHLKPSGVEYVPIEVAALGFAQISFYHV